MINTLFLIALVMGIMLVVPILCRKIHVPSIVGFILAGTLIGPSCLNLVGESPTINLLGSIGMLYIMFQSGSEIDMNDFRHQRYHSLLFGLLSFLLPMMIGFASSFWLLQLDAISSLLLGAMYGSHTLMTYPIVSRYGIQKNRAVNITVGATMWAITFSLLVLAIVESSLDTSRTILDYAKLIVYIAAFLGIVMGLFPWLARLFFKRDRDLVSGFVLVMLMMVVSAYLADVAGLEGILGAFICGVSLNRLLPNHSPLMRRISFMGNSMFIPLFLISVGLLIDVQVFWSGWSTLLIALVMIVSKLLGKSLSAWIGQWFFGFSAMERQLVFGLTHATAAGTLAIVTIGFQMGILSSEVLNAAVLMILLLCTSASFITEYASKQIALHEKAQLVSDHEDDFWLLTSVGIDLRTSLRELSLMTSLNNVEISQSPDWQDVIYKIEHISKSVLVYHEKQPINTISRILVAVPRYAEKERDFITCFGLVRRLAGELGAEVIFYAHPDTQIVLRALCRRPGKMLQAKYRDMDGWEDVLLIAKDMRDNDMPVLISSRKATASYNPLFEQIPATIEQFFSHANYMVMYPEQQTGGPEMDVLMLDNPPASSTWSLVSWIKRIMYRLFFPKKVQEE